MIESAWKEGETSVSQGLMSVGLGKPWHLPPPQRCDVPTCGDLWPILRVPCLGCQWSWIWGKRGDYWNWGWICDVVPLGSCGETQIPDILSLWHLFQVSIHLLWSHSLPTYQVFQFASEYSDVCDLLHLIFSTLSWTMGGGGLHCTCLVMVSEL